MSKPNSATDFGSDGLEEIPPTQDPTLSISAVGSCRIVGPLRLMMENHPTLLNQSGVYGYSHSCAEVRQHLTHLISQTRPPWELLPVLAPRTQSDGALTSVHKRSDYYVFELSSAKEISVEGHPVQLNYFNKHFADFLSDVLRTREFWRKARRANSQEMLEFLEACPEYRALPESDQRLLRLTRLELATPARLMRDIEAIRAAVPEHLFVTHFDAFTRDGNKLEARADYLTMVRNALSEVGANWYDPSESVATFGQDLALDDPDKSLSHFSYSFEQFLSSNWWDRYFSVCWKELKLDLDMRARIKQAAVAATPRLPTPLT